MCCWTCTMFHLILIISNCRKSVTCTHVSGFFPALVSFTPAQFQATPSSTDDMESPFSITSYICKWKVLRKRKEQHENAWGPVWKACVLSWTQKESRIIKRLWSTSLRLQRLGNNYSRYLYAKGKRRNLEYHCCLTLQLRKITETPVVVSTEKGWQHLKIPWSYQQLSWEGLKEKQEINPDHHFGFLCAGTGSQLYILGRSLSAYQLLHIIWCCALLIPSHLTVLQLNGKKHMKPVLLRNIESTTTAEVTLTWWYLMLALPSQRITHS